MKFIQSMSIPTYIQGKGALEEIKRFLFPYGQRIENGDDIKTVQNNLGHATAAFTLNIYAHTTQKMRQESADRMERFIQSVSGGQK